ncbi:hypothetical protein QTP88_028345 [Uroleucon formosanum]
MNNKPGPSGISNSPPIKKKRLTDQEIFNLIENPLSSDEDFDLSSDTDLGEGDSADDDVEINNSVDDMVSDDIGGNNANDLDDAVIEEVSPLHLDEENSETGTLSPPRFNYSPPTIRDPTSNYTWLENSPNLDTIDFNENVGLKINPDGDKPIDFFNLLLTNDFFEFIVRETNDYAADLYMNRSSDKSRITKWIDIDVNELKIFFGLLLHTGTIKMPKMSDYWKNDELFNLNCFREKMSRNRYMLIMRALHFCKNPEADEEAPSRIYKVEKVLDYFNKRMHDVYQPCKNLSLDESMVLWRGRLLFRQYIKNKRHKYGVKLYMLTENQGLVQQIMIYSGQGTGVLPGVSHTEYVVDKLMQNYYDKGYSLFMDNYYNSVKLAHQLLQRKTYCTGTLRSNRKDNPKEIVKKNLKSGESVGKYTKDGVCVLKWKDKRDVLCISSEFENKMYNKNMSGIDRQDQLMSYYPAERKTLPLLSANSNPVPRLDPQIPERHFPCKVEKNHKLRYIHKRCRLCASVGKREETFYNCNKCDTQPGTPVRGLIRSTTDYSNASRRLLHLSRPNKIIRRELLAVETTELLHNDMSSIRKSMYRELENRNIHDKQLAVTLRFLATGDSYMSLSYLFKISKQSISEIIPEVCTAIIDVLKEFIKDVPPAVSAPLTDAPPADALPADFPSADAPMADSPSANSPSADAPMADSPSANSPSADAPMADSPSANSPSADAPMADSPSADAPSADAPSADAPSADAPMADSPSADAPSADAPMADSPSECAPPKVPSVRLNLRVRKPDNSYLIFQIKATTPLFKLMRVYCENSEELLEDGINLRYNGEVVSGYDTAMSLNIKDGDVLEAFTDF